MVIKALGFIWMSYRVPNMVAGVLPEDSHQKTSHKITTDKPLIVVLLLTGMHYWSPSLNAFYTVKAIFRKMCSHSNFCLLCNKNDYNQSGFVNNSM